jgi:hypothetical protein
MAASSNFTATVEEKLNGQNNIIPDGSKGIFSSDFNAV